MSSTILDVTVQSKVFNGLDVLKDVQFKVSEGELVSIVGSSGCGKSTLLRIISGLDQEFKGGVQVAGEAARLHSGHVGFVFQEPRLLPWLTVEQNVGFEAGANGAKHPRVADLLSEVGLSEFADAYPKQLSGGMAQRASIARGLFNHPRLLLLDEPFSAVDAFTKMRLQDLLLGIVTRRRTTVLLVTHDIDEAVYLSDRVLVMGSNPGQIIGSVSISQTNHRNRAHPMFARLKSEVLELLDQSSGFGQSLFAQPNQVQPVNSLLPARQAANR